MKIKQKDFFEKNREYGPNRISHGGEDSLGLRKIRRPLDRKRPVHLCMKASCARGHLTMLGINRVKIAQIVNTWSRRFHVTLHGFENVGNHLHFILSFKVEEGFQNFLRTISALIAREVTGARRGKPFGKS